jgi:murein DD-endopeptidase MepM/ murein hydrolase activator NlpD
MKRSPMSAAPRRSGGPSLALAVGGAWLLATLPVAAPAAAAAGRGGWTWPLVGPPAVVRGFQPPPEPWLAGHRGADLLGSPGVAVRAAGPGEVSFAGPVAGKPVVVVNHAGGARTTYEPVIAAVAVGDHVAGGSVIGRLSAAGSHCAPRTCLHWGLRRGETYLDPLALVGAVPRVRLLPVWDRSAGSVAGAPGALAALAAPPPDTSAAARLGALNRARASPD